MSDKINGEIYYWQEIAKASKNSFEITYSEVIRLNEISTKMITLLLAIGGIFISLWSYFFQNYFNYTDFPPGRVICVYILLIFGISQLGYSIFCIYRGIIITGFSLGPDVSNIVHNKLNCNSVDFLQELSQSYTLSSTVNRIQILELRHYIENTIIFSLVSIPFLLLALLFSLGQWEISDTFAIISSLVFVMILWGLLYYYFVRPITYNSEKRLNEIRVLIEKISILSSKHSTNVQNNVSNVIGKTELPIHRLKRISDDYKRVKAEPINAEREAQKEIDSNKVDTIIIKSTTSELSQTLGYVIGQDED
ncbi:MAG: hypothetical protein KAS32_10250 [Candidatus Peribacteraceae bacterium]|nr:hypothetical protein [Candidatus Peribacteraceae bacterium]